MSTSSVPGERIAKVLARRGVASRREVERMIADGRVSLNGKTLSSPAQNVVDSDRIIVDGKPVAAAEPARLWRYNKPLAGSRPLATKRGVQRFLTIFLRNSPG